MVLTLLMFFEDPVDNRDFREIDAKPFNFSQDEVYFADDFLTTFDGVVIGFMEVVGCSI